MTCRRIIPEGKAHPRHLGIHVGHGMFFDRLADGSVQICAHPDWTGAGDAVVVHAISEADFDVLLADLDRLEDGQLKNTPPATLEEARRGAEESGNAELPDDEPDA